jgi:hypothetical protein
VAPGSAAITFINYARFLIRFPASHPHRSDLQPALLPALLDRTGTGAAALVEPDRIVRFWSALANELRALGATTLHTLEMPELVGTDIRVPVSGMSSLAEVMVLLRYLELRSRLYRLISCSKCARARSTPRSASSRSPAPAWSWASRSRASRPS